MSPFRWVIPVLGLSFAFSVAAEDDPLLRVPSIVSDPPAFSEPANDIIPASTNWRFWRRRPSQPYCPPGQIPGDIKVPDPTDPTNPPQNPNPVNDPLARAPEAGTQAASTFNPNLFGDQLTGSGQGVLGRRIFLTIQRTGAQSSDDYARYLGIVNTKQYVPNPGFDTDFPAQVTIEGRTLKIGSPNFTSTNTIASIPGIRQTNLLIENPQVTSILEGIYSKSSAKFVSGRASEQADSGSIFTPHRIDVVYDITQVGIGLALPPDGGVVGRTKLSDDNNPLPMDRMIFNYDYYSNAVLAAGLDVHRIALGMEKTFWDRQASFEVRLPFASTLDHVTGAGGVAARGIELGNLFTALKALFYQSENLNASTGVALSLPTAANSKLLAFDGREFVRVKNQSVLLTPFLAALFTPGERFFAQAWLQGSFDLSSNPVYTDFDATGLKYAGRLRDQTRLSADLQLGYWIYRRTSGDGLRGIAPFFEIHYNTTLSDADQVFGPPRTVIGPADRRFDEMNASVGFTTLFGTNLMVMTGLVVPLRDGDNRFFDYQLGLRVNWFYGPTARARELADATGRRPEPLPRTAGIDGPLIDSAIVQSSAIVSDDPLCSSAATTCPNPCAISERINPGFFGDLIGVNSRTAIAPFAQLPVLPRYVGLKPTDNDGPRPGDRFFLAASQFADVNGSLNSATAPSLRLNRQVIGFETSFDERVSVGLRLPFLQLDGSSAVENRDVGDLTAVFKYAVVNDPSTGNVFTLGMNLTLPTGGRSDRLDTVVNGDPLPRAVFVQPWVGAVWNAGDLFLQGTSAVLLPTDPAYPVALFNSVGAGYWLYRNESTAYLRGITPVLEFHVNSPLTNRGADNSIVLRDQVNLTSGIFFQFQRLNVGVAIGVPLVGPRPYDAEYLLTANYNF